MTIGLIALRAAKEQLAAAIASIKQELSNPELCEQIKFEVFNIGSDLDDHLTGLGMAMPDMFADKTAAAAGERITLLDPTQGAGLVEGLVVAPATEGGPGPEVIDAEPAAAAITLGEEKPAE